MMDKGQMYILYGALGSFWVFFDAPRNKASRWWSVGILILPLITPAYFFKTRPKGQDWKLIGIWLLGFFIFHTIGMAFNILSRK